MQISGRLVIVVMFALAFAMSGGAWLYQYNYSRRSAEFWGESSRLIGKSPELQFLELAPLELPDDRRPLTNRKRARRRLSKPRTAAKTKLQTKPSTPTISWPVAP